jgi:hypothetical protein
VLGAKIWRKNIPYPGKSYGMSGKEATITVCEARHGGMHL